MEGEKTGVLLKPLAVRSGTQNSSSAKSFGLSWEWPVGFSTVAESRLCIVCRTIHSLTLQAAFKLAVTSAAVSRPVSCLFSG